MRLQDQPLTAPSVEPVTVAECKLDARIDGAEFDGVLPVYISAARQMCEQETGRRLTTQAWRAESADWPGVGDVIPCVPATAAVVTYLSADGSTWATLAADQWVMLQAPGGIVIVPSSTASWPALPDVVGPRVRVDVTCGYGTTADSVPASLRMWIRAAVVAMVNDPALAVQGKAAALNPMLAGLLDPHRVWAR